MIIQKSIFVFLLVCFVSPSITAQSVNVEVEYLFNLTEGIEFGQPGHVIQPHRITTDSEGNIFVSDRRQLMILKFYPDGSFAKQIGRSGRGPGEFNEITALTVDNENRLLVLDRMQFKVSRFNLATGSVEEHRFEDLRQINMMTLQSLPNDRFAGIYVESPFPEGEEMKDDGSIRVYDFGKSVKSATFFDYFAHQFNRNVSIEQHMGMGIGHRLEILNDDHVVAGHRVYYGFHNVVNLHSREVSKFENAEIQPPYYVDIGIEERPESLDDRFAGAVSAFGQLGSFYYQILYMSMTMAGINGQLFHVYRKNEELGFGSEDYLEVFDSDGILIFHGSISDYLPQDEHVSTRIYAHLDSQLRLFVIDYFQIDDPGIRVYRIDIEGQ